MNQHGVQMLSTRQLSMRQVVKLTQLKTRASGLSHATKFWVRMCKWTSISSTIAKLNVLVNKISNNLIKRLLHPAFKARPFLCKKKDFPSSRASVVSTFTPPQAIRLLRIQLIFRKSVVTVLASSITLALKLQSSPSNLNMKIALLSANGTLNCWKLKPETQQTLLLTCPALIAGSSAASASLLTWWWT